MRLSRYGAKVREETRPAQGVRSHTIKDTLILTLVALLSFRVSRRINFNAEGTFIYKLWQLTNFFNQKEFHVLTLVSLHLHDIPLQQQSYNVDLRHLI